MAKKAKKKTVDVSAELIKEREVQPGPGAYIKAVVQLAKGWIKQHNIMFAIGVFVVLAIVVGLVFVLKPGSANLTNDQIVLNVSRELNINGDGNPVVLTVIDKDKASQPFLEQSQNDDKVILYYKAKKAVLYRPSEKRIVHQGTYTPPDAKVFLRRGSDDNTKVEQAQDLIEQVEGVDIVSQDASPNKDYKGVTIVNVTDRYDEKVQEIAKLFDVQVVRMPAGESFPDADILIIVGN